MVNYYQLVFYLTSRKYTPKEQEEHRSRWLANNLASNIEKGWEKWKQRNLNSKDVEILGNDYYTSEGMEDMIINWCRIPALDSKALIGYYDNLGTFCPRSPIYEEEDEELFDKHNSFKLSMSLFLTQFKEDLENLEKNYDLEFHVKPNVIKDKIEIEFNYNNSFFVVDEENINSIYNSLNSLSIKDKRQLRHYRAKKILKEFYQMLKKEVPSKKQKLFIACLKNEQPTPSDLTIYVNSYKNLKTNLEKTTKETDLLKFDETVNTLYETAKKELEK